MADEARVTIGVSKKAKETWVSAAKTLGISQWEMAEIMFRLADPTNDVIKSMAMQIRSKNEMLKEKKKELADKMAKMTPEQIEAILNA